MCDLEMSGTTTSGSAMNASPIDHGLINNVIPVITAGTREALPWGASTMTDSAFTDSRGFSSQALSRPALGDPSFGQAIPVACRACGATLIYPRPCPLCAASSTWVTVDAISQPPLGTACWHLREGDPYEVERWWNGSLWTTHIRGGEKMRWLEDLTALPADMRTPYTADQVELLTFEIERIAWAIDPLGPPSGRKKPWYARLHISLGPSWWWVTGWRGGRGKCS